MDIHVIMEEMGKRAKAAERVLAVATEELKNTALLHIADALMANTEKIIDANQIDLENGRNNGMASSMLDRLKLDAERIKGMADGVRNIAELPDPVGKVLREIERPNGLVIKRVSVPLGVVAVIFEARPNVTSDAAALCLKSGNTVILRGGKEAIHSNMMIAQIMREAVKKAGFPEDVIQLVEITSRESANELMKMKDYVDVLIPRGGAGLIQAVVKNSIVPVIETGVGNCHIYIDKDADIRKAVDITFNAKTSRVSVCNAAESLLVHKDIAEEVLVAIKEKLDEKNVILRGDEKSVSILGDIEPAEENDWATEYLDYKMSVKIVDSVEEAISHIFKYSTGHSECIVTENMETAEKFLNEVDSAAVYVNASTRFTDGGEFGFGAEIGISTQKMHARGPVGLPELQSFKYKIYGNGQIR